MPPPNAKLAEVSREKVVEYLLNSQHPDGAGKAAFFLGAGFVVERWEELANALKGLALHASVASRVDSSHGSKYIVDGEIETPRGQSVSVRTVWIIDSGRQILRLVTAYPLRQDS